MGVPRILPVVACVCKHVQLLLIMIVEYRTALPRQLNECENVFSFSLHVACVREPYTHSSTL